MPGLLIAAVDYLPSRGGAAMMAHHLANAFHDIGVHTRVLAPTQPAETTDLPRRYELCWDQAAKPRHRDGKLWVTEELPRLLEKISVLYNERPFDRALVTHPFYYGPALLEFCRPRDIPLSTSFLGFELKSQLIAMDQSYGRKLVNLIRNTSEPSLSWLTVDLCRRSDEVIPISRYTASLVSTVTDRQDITVIGCGLAMEDYQAARNRFQNLDTDERMARRRKLGIPTDRIVVGCLNRLVESKNVSMLLRAIASNTDFHGLIVGSGPMKEALWREASELGISERLTWVEDVSEYNKWEYLACMDSFCLLSKEMPNGQVEGFGIVLLEAAAAGTPVICCNSGGMVDVVEHMVTGQLVKVDNHKELVDAVNRYRTSPELVDIVVTNAQKQILERYNWKSIASRLATGWGYPVCPVTD